MPATKQEAVTKAKANGLLCTTCSKLSLSFEAKLTKDSGLRIRFPRHARCTCKVHPAVKSAPIAKPVAIKK